MKKITKSFRKYWFIWIPALILVGYFLIYRPIAVQLDKQRFQKAEIEVAKVADQIETKIGKADQRVQDNSCGRAHLKNSRGPLLCSVSEALSYTVLSVESANQKLENLLPLGSGDIRSGPGRNHDNRFIADAIPQTLLLDYKTYYGLTCSFSYSYHPEKAMYRYLDINNETSFVVDISCGGKAQSTYYQLR